MGGTRDILRGSGRERRWGIRHAQGRQQAGPQVARVACRLRSEDESLSQVQRIVVHVNLPNAITAARIAVAPVIAWMIVLPSWPIRLAAWILYVIAAVTDYYDGKLARSRNLVTDLGRLLDPLADKMLLVCTLGPMLWVHRGLPLVSPLPLRDDWAVPNTIGPVMAGPHEAWPVVTPIGLVALPLWVSVLL